MKHTSRIVALGLTVPVVIAAVIFMGLQSCRQFEEAIVTQELEHLQTIARTESQHIEIRFADTLDELKVLSKNLVIYIVSSSSVFC